MKITINAPAAVLLAGTLALTSGCGDESTPTPSAASAPATTTAAASPPASPTPPPDAGPALAKAVAATTASDFSFSLSENGESVTGKYDADTKGVRLDHPEGAQHTLSMTAMGDDFWVEVEPNTFGHYSNAKMPDGNPLLFLSAPVAALDLLAGAGGVTVDGNGEYKGAIDLTKVSKTNPAVVHLVSDFTEHVGASATALPFTAKLDPQGRIDKVQIDLAHGNTDGNTVVYGFSAFDYGKPVSVTKPTGRIVEMPAQAYQ
ncbi:hypothetical protein AB0M46_44585 [Dactylosporangium sp. NPDC051485]|uniref:hypothetical protein n=1 Tax=Dactylosporangium sp. NPDC051485 TaxID=3154846 RepID=UPI0034320719